MDSDELYQELIVDHSKHPRCFGTLISPDATINLLNPLCGDNINLEIKLRDGNVHSIAFEGHGCSISQASTSMMSELCLGKSIEEVKAFIDIFHRMMKGEVTEEELDRLGDASALQGVQRFAARIKCAMLGWEALSQCLQEASKTRECT